MSIDLTEYTGRVKREPKERLSLIRSLTVAEQSAVFVQLSPYVQQEILKQFTNSEAVSLIDHCDPRQAENILSHMKDLKRRTKIITKVKTDAREKIEYFLRFHPKATTSLISFNYVVLPDGATIGQAADALDEHYQDTGAFPEIFIQSAGKVTGEVPLSVLVRQRNTALLKRFIIPVQTITYQAEVGEVIDVFSSSQRKKVVVLDYDESILGVIYADDALQLFGKLPTESFYNISGLDESERPFDTAWEKFTHRRKWLVLNLVTCFMAGSMIFVFKDTLDQLVILAMYIPIVAGMGGNAGSQTFAVMLRGLTLGTISFTNGWLAIKREVGAALLNGVLIGAIVAIISLLWNESAILGLVVGISMICVHVVAGFTGAFVPLFLKHIGKDPAAMSTMIITTATDVLGLLCLLGLGSWLMM